jgi:gamma-glutamyl:cysteine ligase YbdK (ATP-grasp superfamily)
LELGNAAAWVAALIAFFAVNASTIQWLLKRRDDQHERDSSRVTILENALTELRVSMPLEYVRREDWIRFSGTLDAKLDAMREEVREQIGEVKDRLYAGRN